MFHLPEIVRIPALVGGLAVFALALTACSSQESKVGGMLNLETNMTLTLQADANINPDHQDESSPVFIRLYELKSRNAFDGADFIELYERDKAVLGDTFVQRRKLSRIAPGESREHDLVLDNNTRYVGLVAEFFQYQDAAYKVIFPVTAKNVFRDDVRVRISGNQISVVN